MCVWGGEGRGSWLNPKGHSLCEFMGSGPFEVMTPNRQADSPKTSDVFVKFVLGTARSRCLASRAQVTQEPK